MKSKKIKKIAIAISLIALMLLLSIFIFKRVSPTLLKGDSGFDSSYDSGSSWDSGSSYDSDSSWDSYSSSDWGSSYDRDSSYSGSSGTSRTSSSSFSILDKISVFFAIIFVIFFVVATIIDILYILKRILNFFKRTLKRIFRKKVVINSKPLSEEKIKMFIPNYNEKFLQERYLDYLEIQRAWQDFDYDTLRKKLTDELYNQNEMQLATLKAQERKNVMKEFIYKDSFITNVKEENGLIIVTLELMCEFYDYIEQKGAVIRGNRNVKIKQHYEMTFVCAKLKNVNKCPNCGAKLNGSVSNKCEYCGSIITGLSNEWTLSKKRSIRQY